MKKKLFPFIVICALAMLCSGCGGSGLPKSSESAGYRWMSMYLPWTQDSLLSGLGGQHVELSDKPSVDLDSCGGYVLYVAFGSNKYNCYAVLRLDSRGNAVAAFQDPASRKYKQKSFKVSAKTMRELQEVLVRNKAGAFDESYVDVRITEGTQGGLTLLTHQGARRTYFSNEWPSGFRDIATFLQDYVLKYNSKSMDMDFHVVRSSILQDDPEATRAVRGLVRDPR